METKYVTEKDLYCAAKMLQAVIYTDDETVGSRFDGCNYCKYFEDCFRKVPFVDPYSGKETGKEIIKIEQYFTMLEHLNNETGVDLDLGVPADRMSDKHWKLISG